MTTPFLTAAPGSKLLDTNIDLDPSSAGASLHVTIGVADDGAALMYIDTDFEPDGSKLRVNVNDGPVYGYPESVHIADAIRELAAWEASDPVGWGDMRSAAEFLRDKYTPDEHDPIHG